MRSNHFWRLLGGDAIVLGLVTLVGFASHETLQTAGLRILMTFLPLLLAWLLVAPHLGVFDPARITAARQLWRPFWAMILAAPFAVFLRGLLLNTSISPVFVIIIGGISAIALLLWRGAYIIIFTGVGNRNG